MSAASTLAAAKAYALQLLADHVAASDPHAYVDSSHGAGYARLIDGDGNVIAKDVAILKDGDTQPSTSTVALLFGIGSNLGVWIPGDGGVGWVNIVHNAAPVDTTPPTSPSNLVVTNLTPTGFTLTWTGSTDVSGIARYETKIGSGLFTSNGTLLTRDFTGLTPGDVVVQVVAVDGSAAANRSTAAQLTVTVPTGGGGGGGTVTTAMGVNYDTKGSEYDGQWKALRVYSTSKVAPAIASGAKYIAFTDEPGISVTGGTSSVNLVKALLDTTYGGPGTPSKNATVFMAVGNGNEVDTNYANGFNNTQFADTCEAMAALCDTYDNASFWLDCTRFHIGNGSTAAMFALKTTSGKTIGSLLAAPGRGMAGSYYPPGQDNGTYGYPHPLAQMYTTATDTPSGIVDQYVTLAASYGITRMAIWEFGIPAAINPPPYSGSAGSVYQDKNARPNWVKALIEYWMDACVAHGMTPEACFYWDSQTGTPIGGAGNTNHDERFSTDHWFSPAPNPTTASVVFNAVANHTP